MKSLPQSSSPQPQQGTGTRPRLPREARLVEDGQDAAPAPDSSDRVLQIDFVIDPGKGVKLSALEALAQLGKEFAAELETQGLAMAGPQRFEMGYFRGPRAHRVICPPEQATHGTAIIRVRVRKRPPESTLSQLALGGVDSPHQPELPRQVTPPCPGLRELAARLIGVPHFVFDDGKKS